MIDAALLSTMGFALAAGVATFFSPCAYPLLPGYVGFYLRDTGGNEGSLSGAFARGLVAGVGVLASFLALFGAAFLIGRETISNVTLFEPLVGVLLVVFGALVLFDRAPSLSIALPKRRTGILGFGIFGAGYALAAAGCVIWIVVGVVTRAIAMPVASAVLVLGTYVGTVVTLMVALTVATGMGLLAGAGRLAAYSGTLERAAGAIMIAAGIAQLYLAIVVLEAI